MTPCDFGAAALPNSNREMSSKSKDEYQHLGSQTLTGPSNAYMFSENSGTIDGNRHTPPALR